MVVSLSWKPISPFSWFYWYNIYKYHISYHYHHPKLYNIMSVTFLSIFDAIENNGIQYTWNYSVTVWPGSMPTNYALIDTRIFSKTVMLECC